MTEIRHLLEAAEAAALEAGIAIKKVYRSGAFSTTLKADASPVISADINTHGILVDQPGRTNFKGALINKVVALAMLLLSMLVFTCCEPCVRLSASWIDSRIQPVRFQKILVMAIGKDLQKRMLGEDNIRKVLKTRGFNAGTSLDELGPGFASRRDTANMQRLLLDKQFDAVITVRVVGIDERDRRVPGGVYYGPVGFNQGFFGYFYQAWGYYPEAGYRETVEEVLLESNLYKVRTGELLWSGQSKAFTRNPSPAMAERYGKNIVDDMIKQGVLIY